jgi:hypothetical protein
MITIARQSASASDTPDGLATRFIKLLTVNIELLTHIFGRFSASFWAVWFINSLAVGNSTVLLSWTFVASFFAIELVLMQCFEEHITLGRICGSLLSAHQASYSRHKWVSTRTGVFL